MSDTAVRERELELLSDNPEALAVKIPEVDDDSVNSPAEAGHMAVEAVKTGEQMTVAAEVGPVAVNAAAVEVTNDSKPATPSTRIRASRTLMGGYDGQRTFGWTKPRRLYGIPIGR